MKLGLISDTHGLLRPEAVRALEGVGHIIHAGDIGDSGIVPRLRQIAPVSAIRGNVDFDEWTEEFPETLTFALEGQGVHVLHDAKSIAFDPAARGVALVVSGHSHQPRIETLGGVLWINPGSAGPRRFRLPVTVALLTVTPDGFSEARICPLVP